MYVAHFYDYHVLACCSCLYDDCLYRALWISIVYEMCYISKLAFLILNVFCTFNKSYIIKHECLWWKLLWFFLKHFRSEWCYSVTVVCHCCYKHFKCMYFLYCKLLTPRQIPCVNTLGKKTLSDSDSQLEGNKYFLKALTDSLAFF